MHPPALHSDQVRRDTNYLRLLSNRATGGGNGGVTSYFSEFVFSRGGA